MSGCKRSMDDIKIFFKGCKNFTLQQRMDFYDEWAKNYNQDTRTLDYRAPRLAVDLLNENFSGSRGEVQILDVACGSGLAAQLMVELGFRNFVGIDGSKGMLDQAAQTGLYQDLKLAILGPEPLPAQTGLFDMVLIISGLNPACVPVSVVRELCNAAKPGGLVCMVRGQHNKTTEEEQYKEDLLRELWMMENEGLWSPMETRLIDRYMIDTEADEEDTEDLYISGAVYLYRKCNV